MITNRNVNQKINHYLRNKLGMYEYRRGWLKGDCPYCGAHKFGVNLNLNRSNCFKCGSHPPPLYLVMDLENITTKAEALVVLGTYEGLEYREEIIKPFELKSKIELPEGFTNLMLGDSQLAKAARNYVKKRGFDIFKMAASGWGYGTKGKYMGYLIMPFYLNGRLVYFNARRFFGYGPKFNNPLVEDFGMGKNMLTYNADALYLYKTIWGVESIMNAETIGDNAIAFGGKKISNYQINDILRSPCEKFIIGLDPDAIEDAIKLALRLYGYKKVKLVIPPTGKDINDIGRKKAITISHKNKYLSYQELISLKLTYS